MSRWAFSTARTSLSHWIWIFIFHSLAELQGDWRSSWVLSWCQADTSWKAASSRFTRDFLCRLLLPTDFIFNRLDWIRQGGEKPFHYVAPHPGDYHDLCTLAYLIDNRETSLAHDLVRLLPRPPSILLPSATATAFNDNYLHVNPFRRRMRRRRRSTTSSPLKPEVCKFSCY